MSLQRSGTAKERRRKKKEGNGGETAVKKVNAKEARVQSE